MGKKIILALLILSIGILILWLGPTLAIQLMGSVIGNVVGFGIVLFSLTIIIASIWQFFSSIKSAILSLYIKKDNYSKDEPKTDNSGKKSDDDDDNFTNEEHYGKVLGLKGKIKVDDIQRAYHNKIKEYHPDKVAMMGDELKEMATQKTKEINEAYEYFKKKYN